MLSRVVLCFHVLLHAYCLMDNQFQLLVEPPEANLSQAMGQFNGAYTQAFNRRHQRVGHVLQGRFKAIIVDRNNYLLELCRYVVLNPVRARITRKPDSYPWSSYRATAGLAPTPPYLTTDWLLAQFGRQHAAAQRKYQAFVVEGIGQGSPWEEVRGQVLLGSERFVERLVPGLRDKHLLKEFPRRQRFAARPTLSQLLGAKTRTDRVSRNDPICRAHLDYGYSLAEIGHAVGLHYATISRIANPQDAG